MSSVADRIGVRIPGMGSARPERSDRDAGTPDAVRPGPPTGPRDRRAMVALASLVVVGASIATFAGMYASAGHRTAAVVVEHPLAQGQMITSADLGQADVSVSGAVQIIPVEEASMIEGKHAASAIPAGSLLTVGDLATAPTVAAGDAVVGVALKDGQFPAAGLTPGEQVLVVQTGTPGSPLAAAASTSSGSSSTTQSAAGSTSGSALSGTGTGVLVPVATVLSVAAPGSASGGSYALLVSVEVASTVAPDVATAASADQVSLVLLPAGTTTGASA